MILLIDNYDSFTYNLYQYLRETSEETVEVHRNDEITIEEIEARNPSRLVISPGPGRPEDAGISVEAVRHFAGKLPILGVCLGHQAIAAAFGGKITASRRIVHGKCEWIRLDGKGLFRAMDSEVLFTRYHSLAVESDSLPEVLEVSASSTDGEIMGVRHKELCIEGVQFHPESIAGSEGKRLLSNFLRYKRESFVPKIGLAKLLAAGHMNQDEAENFMEELTEGNLSQAQIAAFLIGMTAGGINAEEIAGCARVLKRKRVPVELPFPLLDTCGTGGDGKGTFNISSFAALIAASCGAKVAKHGNRAVSSVSGSADFYKALGIDTELRAEEAADMIEKSGFAFLFAPFYHKAMRHAASVRKELGVKTIMNLLGPLSNPAGASYQLIGVFAPEYVKPVAEAAILLGLKRVLVVHGAGGIDEISVSGETYAVYADAEGCLEEMTIKPEDFGISSYQVESLTGGSALENAALARALLGKSASPEERVGAGPIDALREAVCLNAGAAVFIYGLATGLKEGYEMAKDALLSGETLTKTEEIIRSAREMKANGTENQKTCRTKKALTFA